MTEVPEGLPTLSGGSHHQAEGQACVMEYVSVLAGNEWTDYPACTNPIIACVAQCVNDNMADSERHRLVPLIGRLLAASNRSAEVNRALLNALNHEPTMIGLDGNWANATHVRYSGLYGETRFALTGRWDAKSRGRETPSYYAQDTLAYSLAARDWAEMSVDYLTNLLDVYDRVAPDKPKVEPISEDALNRARTLIETKALI